MERGRGMIVLAFPFSLLYSLKWHWRTGPSLYWLRGRQNGRGILSTSGRQCHQIMHWKGKELCPLFWLNLDGNVNALITQITIN
jgi:hypothetical protein